MVDIRLAELVFNEKQTLQPIAVLQKMGQDILAAHGKVVANIETSIYLYPNNFEDFLILLKRLHNEVFEVTGLKFSGELRTNPVFVGSGANEFQGSEVENITSDLKNLYDHTFLPLPLPELQKCTERAFLRTCARFMEELLKIHPFSDGNGRLTRLCLYFFAKQSGKYRFRSFNTDSRSIEEYLDALEFGHRHNRPAVAGESRQDPFRHLQVWLEKHLDRQPINSQTEEQKPHWIP